MVLSSDAIKGIAIGGGVLFLNICVGFALFYLRRRTQRAQKHAEESDTSRPLTKAWQHNGPTRLPESPTSSYGDQSYQGLLMALKMRPVSRLPTPMTEKSRGSLEEPLMPVKFYFEPSLPTEKLASPVQAVVSVATSLAAQQTKARVQSPVPESLTAAPAQPQYAFLVETTPLPSWSNSRPGRIPTKKSSRSARSSLRRHQSFDTASMYSVASAPLSQHDALLKASLEELIVREPPSSAPAWMQYARGQRTDDLTSIAEVSVDGSGRSPMTSPLAASSPPAATTPLPSPPQLFIRPHFLNTQPSGSRASVRRLPSPPLQPNFSTSSPGTPPSLDRHPNIPPGLYPRPQHPDALTLGPSLTRVSPFQTAAAPTLPPPPRAQSIDDMLPVLSLPLTGRPSSHHPRPTPPSVSEEERPVSAAPAVPARSPYRRTDSLPRTLLAGPYASRLTRHHDSTTAW